MGSRNTRFLTALMKIPTCRALKSLLSKAMPRSSLLLFIARNQCLKSHKFLVQILKSAFGENSRKEGRYASGILIEFCPECSSKNFFLRANANSRADQE